MKKISFTKYTSYGNNFVIVDETNSVFLKEQEKSAFAYQATNTNYGVGSDNFLVIQPCTEDVLKKINKIRHYWSKSSNIRTADFVFRMFEPDGVEAFCCANGLMCIANYLYHSKGIKETTILTEIPTSEPKVVSIGTNSIIDRSWINLGRPRKIPADIVNSENAIALDNDIDVFENIKITFRKYDLEPFSDKQVLELTGYLVFTGEPHMVVFSDTDWSIRKLAELVFISSLKKNSLAKKPENRVEFGTWLVNHIGTTLNKKYQHIFPSGINVNFVHVHKNEPVLEYRCFERGIFKETLSCGTGALASAFVAKKLKRIKSNQMAVWPHRCRWDDSSAQILVKDNKNGWILNTNQIKLFSGEFLFCQSLEKTTSIAEAKGQLAMQAMRY